ncbi:helicase [Cellulophaga phage phi46:1]|uniref:helicase n=1 Tax=Cellulophaga phage phi46:1 TaxID=1327974 RepID=UPI0003515DD4|nr:helicase [Cellulophaga phage phi46:1]AGO47845.1 helicase [Cellulophaga phage phi46:1]
MAQLREYQSDLINNLRLSLKTNNSVCAVLPTGGGKTFTFAFIVKSAWEKGSRVLILTDRTELLTQAGGALKEVGLQPIEIKSGKKPNLKGSLYVGMSETIKRRIKDPEYIELIKNMDIIVVDECHKRSFTKLLQLKGINTRIIGFTATPTRQGKDDLMNETYQDIVVGVEIKYLVENGFLAQPNYYGVKADLEGVKMKGSDYDQEEVANRFSQSKLYAGVFTNWKAKRDNTKTLIFSSNVKNSLEVCEEFNKNGYKCKHLDATMKKERASILRWFHETPNAILSNVGILTTGFDEPSIETVILYRATTSLSLYLQMVGRGSRVIKGVKEDFSVMDFGNNILTHGFWHEVRQWTLTTKKKNTKKKGEAVLKNCKNCDGFMLASAIKCKECGFVDEKEKKAQEIAELQLLDPKDLNRKARRATLDEQIELAKNKLVKPAYILHQLKTIEDVKTFIAAMGYSNAWVHNSKHRYWWGAII